MNHSTANDEVRAGKSAKTTDFVGLWRFRQHRSYGGPFDKARDASKKDNHPEAGYWAMWLKAIADDQNKVPLIYTVKMARERG